MPEETWKLRIIYEQTRRGGDPLSDASYCDYTPIHIETWFQFATEADGNFWFEDIEVAFDPKEHNEFHLVVVFYTSGDTFGHTTGNTCFIKGCLQIDEAHAIKQSIENGTYSAEQTPHGYLPWEGYFEELEKVEVITLGIVHIENDEEGD